MNCIEKHRLEDKWEKLRRKHNNYIHNNRRKFLADNMISFHEDRKAKFLLESIHKDVTFITSYFLIVLIFIKPDYISSFDCISFLENEIELSADCQYWVASTVQCYLDEFVVKIHPDLKIYLVNNNPYGMKIV